jgi:hypothetical protein
MFKKFLVAAAFVTVIAAPAFAQSFDPDVGTGNVIPFAYAPQANHGGNDVYARSSAKSAYAQAPVATDSQSMAVSANGKVVGYDPDPFIRLMLKEEAERGQW